jgi:hypothetical protein
LIRENRGIRQIPALPTAVTPVRKPSPAPLPSDYSAATLPRNTITEHHSEQEDYLWGV